VNPRLVALATPVFVALAGYVATQVERLPGAPQLDRAQLRALFVAGAGAATAAAWKLLSHELDRLRWDYGGAEPELSEEDEKERLRSLLGLSGIEASVSDLRARERVAAAVLDEIIAGAGVAERGERAARRWAEDSGGSGEFRLGVSDTR
jgi:hypothetical protein